MDGRKNGSPRIDRDSVPHARQPNNAAYRSRQNRPSDFYTGPGRGMAGEEYTRSYRRPDDRRREPAKGEIASKGRKKVGEALLESFSRRRFLEKRRGLLLALTFVIMTSLILTLVYKLVFVVNEINISGNEIYTSDQVLEASGISNGVNLYSFRASSVNKSITLHCPYISTVDIDRNVPDSVVLKVSEDTAVYWVNIFGETKLLSGSLRVLETLPDDESVPEGLVKLKLPSVSYSVAGREIRFSDPRHDSAVREILATVSESGVWDKLTSVNVKDTYEITMMCQSRIKLVLGNSDNIYTKLETAAAVMRDDMFSTENKFIIDLTIDGKAGVMMDNLLEEE